MKMILVSNLFPPGYIGGYELGAFDIAQRLAAKGHRIVTLTSDYFLDDAGSISEMHVERTLECRVINHQRDPSSVFLREDVFLNWRNIRRLGSAIRRENPDLVLMFNSAGLGNVGMYQYLSAISMPRITYLMDNIFSSVVNFQEEWVKYKKVFCGVDKSALGTIISMSQNLASEMEGFLPGISAAASYVPGFVDPALFDPFPFRESEELPAAPRHRRFLFCSRVAPHKGTTILLDAVEQLANKGFAHFSVDVFGAGQVTSFQQEITRRKLDGFIRYKGSLSKNDMIAKYRDYEALLFPTWEREPFGFVVSEAAAAGCIPIMTASIGAAEWFLDGADCLKISRHADSLAQAMLNIASMDDSRLALMRSTAATNARRYLTIDHWIDVIENECRKAAAAPRRASNEQMAGIEAAFLALNEIWRDL